MREHNAHATLLDNSQQGRTTTASTVWKCLHKNGMLSALDLNLFLIHRLYLDFIFVKKMSIKICWPSFPFLSSQIIIILKQRLWGYRLPFTEITYLWRDLWKERIWDSQRIFPSQPLPLNVLQCFSLFAAS